MRGLEKKYMGRDKIADKQTDRQTHQYHDSAWPKGQGRVKNSIYIVLYEKNAFRINFGPREVPQSENA